MVYEDREDEFMSMDEQQDLYEPDRYDENLADTFREQIPNESADDPTTEEAMDAEPDMGAPARPGTTDSLTGAGAVADDGFGESLNPEDSPHLEDQLGDQEVSEEAHREYLDIEE